MIRDPVVIVSYVSLVQDRSTEMSAMTHFTRTVTTNYSLIMDANKNPLGRLPAAQRFQIMIYLAIMWTTIFCASLGVWFWYGELIAAHMLLVLGVLLTGMTFSRAEHVAMIPNTIRRRLTRRIKSN